MQGHTVWRWCCRGTPALPSNHYPPTLLLIPPARLPADFTVVTVATLGYGEGVRSCGPVKIAYAGVRHPACITVSPRFPSCCRQHAAGDVVPQTSLEMLVDCGVIAIGVLM